MRSHLRGFNTQKQKVTIEQPQVIPNMCTLRVRRIYHAIHN